MDKYTENRFADFRELSKEQLDAKKAELEDEIEEYYRDLEDNTMNVNKISDILNSDLHLDKDRLEYVNYLLSQFPSVTIK